MPHGILSLSIPGHLSDLPPSQSCLLSLYEGSALHHVPPASSSWFDTEAPKQRTSPTPTPRRAAHTAPRIFDKAPRGRWGCSCRWRRSSAGWEPALGPSGRAGKAGTGRLEVPPWAAGSTPRWSSRWRTQMEPRRSRGGHPRSSTEAHPSGAESGWAPGETAWAPRRRGPVRWWRPPGWSWPRAPWRCRRCPGCRRPAQRRPWGAARAGRETCPPWASASDPEPTQWAWSAPGQPPSSLGPAQRCPGWRKQHRQHAEETHHAHFLLLLETRFKCFGAYYFYFIVILFKCSTNVIICYLLFVFLKLIIIAACSNLPASLIPSLLWLVGSCTAEPGPLTATEQLC